MNTETVQLSAAQLADKAAAREAFLQRLPDYAMSLITGTLRPEIKAKCESKEFIADFVRELGRIQQVHPKPQVRQEAAKLVQPLVILKRKFARISEVDNAAVHVSIKELTGMDMQGKTLQEISCLLLANVLSELKHFNNGRAHQ